jgi:alpha-galactosidase
MILSIAISFQFLVVAVKAVENGLARTPYMGWNNWNSLGCDVSESLLLDTSKILVDVGLRDLGYNYVVLDDCWQDIKGRGDDGRILVNEQKFPHGMKWIAGKLHEQGLFFGMYSSAGEMTCARFEGSLDHEKEDAESFASWDVDFLKYDNCYHLGRFGYPEVSFNRYKVMADALKATGRSILYSLCNWGEDYVNTWGHSIANSFRISGDIYDSFNRPDELCSCSNHNDPHCVAPGSRCSVMYIIKRVAPYVDRGIPGGWNDMDMLEVGHGGMSDDEYVAHFSMWAALKSPLVIGTDLRHLNAKALSILNNPAIIAINQDPLGQSAAMIERDVNVPKDRYGQGETQIWSGPLYLGDQVLIFLNAATEEREMSTTLDDIFVHFGPGGSAPQVKVKWDMYDLWVNRMEDTVAEEILRSSSEKTTVLLEKKVQWYNSTATPYVQGLEEGNERLLGKKIGVALPGKDIKVIVPRHAVKVYRLRPQSKVLNKYTIYRDEL